MKTILLTFFLSIISTSIFSQTTESTSDATDLCNNWINDNALPASACFSNVGTSPIIGELFNDDSQDIFLFSENSSGTLTFSNLPSPTDAIVKIIEYTGTAGTATATEGTSVTISTGSPMFTFVASKKYFLSIEKNVSLVNYSINFSGSLPVQLVSFSGNRVSEGVELIWKTAQEINSQSFEIERSSDALNYKIIGKLEALGNSRTGKTYQFTDSNPKEGINYYRLKQIDIDKENTYFRAISVIYAFEERDLVLYPNPSSQIIKLPLFFVQGASFLNIYNSNGILVKQVKANESNLFLQISDLLTGSYLIHYPK